jgi:hypothetical protein
MFPTHHKPQIPIRFSIFSLMLAFCKTNFQPSKPKVLSLLWYKNSKTSLIYSGIPWQSLVIVTCFSHWKKVTFLELFHVGVQRASTRSTGIIKLWSYVYGQTPSNCWWCLLSLFTNISLSFSGGQQFQLPWMRFIFSCGSVFFSPTLHCADKIIVYFISNIMTS